MAKHWRHEYDGQLLSQQQQSCSGLSEPVVQHADEPRPIPPAARSTSNDANDNIKRHNEWRGRLIIRFLCNQQLCPQQLLLPAATPYWPLVMQGDT